MPSGRGAAVRGKPPLPVGRGAHVRSRPSVPTGSGADVSGRPPEGMGNRFKLLRRLTQARRKVSRVFRQALPGLRNWHDECGMLTLCSINKIINYTFSYEVNVLPWMVGYLFSMSLIVA